MNCESDKVQKHVIKGFREQSIKEMMKKLAPLPPFLLYFLGFPSSKIKRHWEFDLFCFFTIKTPDMPSVPSEIEFSDLLATSDCHCFDSGSSEAVTPVVFFFFPLSFLPSTFLYIRILDLKYK